MNGPPSQSQIRLVNQCRRLERLARRLPGHPALGYKKDVDRTLLRENIKSPVEDRFRKLKELQQLAREVQRPGRKARSRG